MIRLYALLALTVGLGVLSGCSLPREWLWSRWAADYDTAERRFHASGRDMLIVYRDARIGTEDNLPKLLKCSTIKPLAAGYVRCVLCNTYEPDRRYVAQFGVQRAPALILVRQDGTYHARSGPLAEADVRALLTDSTEPGARPRYNPHIPREAQYNWHRTLRSAKQTAERAERPILVLLPRFWSRDAQRLLGYLSQHEVYIRCSDWVHCRLDRYWPWPGRGPARFGSPRLPALVIVRRDGSCYTLETPASAAQIARFLDQSETIGD